MLAPLSMKEVVAERDLLRAEHALEQHRLERRIAALQDASARHRADLGRQAANIVAFEGKTGGLVEEIAALHHELAGKTRDILGLEGELGASKSIINDFSARLDQAAMEIAALQDQRMALETASDDQRTAIAGLETRASGLEMKFGDALQTAKSKATSAQGEASRLTLELAFRTSEIAQLKSTLGEALAKGATVVAALEKKSSELDLSRTRLSEIEALAAERGRALETAALEKGRQHANGGEREPESRTQGDLALREAITRLAADVVRLSDAPADAPPASKPGKPRRRESRAPSSQAPVTGQSVAAAKLRQLQPTGPDR